MCSVGGVHDIDAELPAASPKARTVTGRRREDQDAAMALHDLS